MREGILEKELMSRTAILLFLLAALFEIVAIGLVGADETDPVVLINMGIGLYDLGLYNESITAFEKAIDLSHNESDAWVGVGNVLSAMGRYNESIEAYNKAIEISKRNADAFYGKGNALVRLGRNREAIDCYDQALALRPGYAEAYENRELARSAKSSMPSIRPMPFVRIKLIAKPAGADVWMDGEFIGKAGNEDSDSLEKYFDRAENHTFELKKNGLMTRINVTTSRFMDIVVNLETNETSIEYPYG